MADTAEKIKRLAAIKVRLNRIEPERNELRDEASTLVVDLLKENVSPSEVAELSPFSAAHVRTLARVAGLPPARRGGRRRTAA